MTRTAVILFNLGGPDKRESIRPFLKNFFMDKNIIQAPYPVRLFLSSLIANRRSKREAGDSYSFLGGKSPLLDNTLAQQNALQARFDSNTKIFTVMRYWHPMSDQVAADVKNWAPDKIILLPLYPQFSTTTSWSSAQDWARACRKIGLNVPTRLICCYPFEPGFIEASARNVREAFDAYIGANPGKRPRILFSAHGLPEKIIRQGDPYQWQCEESARKIAAATNIPNLDWQICYQSRVGPLKWIGPSTEEALEKAAHDAVPVLIYPHAFVSEHVETLVEIEIEYREEAEKRGVPGFGRIPTVSVSDLFIDGLARMIRQAQAPIGPDGGKALCPETCKRCCVVAGNALKLCAG
jgi:ferrochelatase